MDDEYPLQLKIDYPERTLSRLSTALRAFMVIPIAILLGTVTGSSAKYVDGSGTSSSVVVSGVGLLVVPTLLMILFRRRYPRWWFDWNQQMLRFMDRVWVYAALMDDRYPSTEDEQSVHLDFPFPDAEQELSRWLPLVKWALAIPHYIVLGFLAVGVFFAVVCAWFAILFTGRYPRSIFRYVEGVTRWHNRVTAYAFILVTDRYPPFRLRP